MPLQSTLSKSGLTRLMPHIIVLSLIGAGVATLAWVGSLTLTDMSEWGKDIGTVFMESRIDQPISLGIGMTVLHYFLIGIALTGAGAVMFLRNRIPFIKSHLATPMKAPKAKLSTPKTTNSPLPQTKPTLRADSAAAQEEKFFSGCLHHFGYLSSRPKDSPIPQECILCQRLGDCMVATVYVNKLTD